MTVDQPFGEVNERSCALNRVLARSASLTLNGLRLMAIWQQSCCSFAPWIVCLSGIVQVDNGHRSRCKNLRRPALGHSAVPRCLGLVQSRWDRAGTLRRYSCVADLWRPVGALAPPGGIAGFGAPMRRTTGLRSDLGIWALGARGYAI